MKLAEAKGKAHQILEEELRYPSVSYRFVSKASSGWQEATLMLIAAQTKNTTAGVDVPLAYQRRQRPRPVTQQPDCYHLESLSFDHLTELIGQVHQDDRASFIAAMLAFVPSDKSAHRGEGTTRFPSYKNCTSFLPLVAELCFRSGYTKEFFQSLQELTMPTVGLLILLLQLEETIALNYTLFSDVELDEIPRHLTLLMHIAKAQASDHTVTRPGVKKPEQFYRATYKAVGLEMEKAITGIKEECRKARIYYLSNELQKRPNLEIEQDKKVVEDYLTKLGFGPDLAGALNAAESEYRSATNKFELKNSLSHLRSFLEHLHRETATSMPKSAGVVVKDGWRDATLFLRTEGVISKQHEAFVTSLYTLLSDESVHPLGAAPEYARLLRNVVIEYGVMFLSVLDKRGGKITKPSP
jgi:hypothetical protein